MQTDPILRRTLLPATVGAPRLARRAVVARCEDLDGDQIAVAELLTSELVTNAVVHPRPPAERRDEEPTIGLHIHRDVDLLRVEVSDHDSQLPPRSRAPNDGLDSGRGLGLVAELATAWGSHPLAAGEGKTVWFELQLQPSLAAER